MNAKCFSSFVSPITADLHEVDLWQVGNMKAVSTEQIQQIKSHVRSYLWLISIPTCDPKILP